VSHVLVGLCRLQQGEVARAIEDFRAARADSGDSSLPLAALAAAYGMAGESPAGEDTLRELMDLGRTRYVPAYQLAIVAVGVGDVEEAFAWLERAYVERAEVLSWLDVEPFWDRIRDDPRFRQLRSRIAPG
jgi:Flp pilus assembly protein TadD